MLARNRYQDRKRCIEGAKEDVRREIKEDSRIALLDYFNSCFCGFEVLGCMVCQNGCKSCLNIWRLKRSEHQAVKLIPVHSIILFLFLFYSISEPISSFRGLLWGTLPLGRRLFPHRIWSDQSYDPLLG